MIHKCEQCNIRLIEKEDKEFCDICTNENKITELEVRILALEGDNESKD